MEKSPPLIDLLVRSAHFLAENPFVGILVCNENNIIFANRSAQKAIGDGYYDLMKMNYWNLVAPQDRQWLKEKYQRAIRGEPVSLFSQFEAINGRGEKMVIATCSFPITHPDSNFMLVVAQDVTETCNKHRLLAESEKLYRDLVENSLQGVVIANKEGIIRYMNERVRNRIGSETESFLGRSIWDFIDPEQRSRAQENFHMVAAGKELPHSSIYFCSRGSRKAVVEVKCALLVFEGEACVQIALIDVTERVQKENHLRQESERLSMVFNGMDVGVDVCDLDSYEILYANDQVKKLFGNPAGKACFEYFFGLNKPCDICLGRQMLRNRVDGEPIRWERKLDNRWYQVILKAIPWQDKKMVRMQISMDITERRIAEEQNKYQAYLLSRVSDCIITADENGMITYTNEGTKKCMGFQPEELVGENVFDLFSHFNDKKALEEVDKTFFSSGFWQGTLNTVDREGKPMVLDVAVHRLDSSGQDNSILMVCHDVTGLVKARRMADKANKAKSDYVSKISHELRTPLGGIIGFADLLIREELDLPRRESVQAINQCAQQMLNLVNDILDLAMMESGRLQLASEVINLYQLADVAVNTVLPLAKSNGTQVIIEKDDKLPEWFLGDKIRIMQILINLLGNAAKFTRNGIIRLIIDGNSREFDTGNPFWLQIRISDNGPGMSREYLNQAFKAFVRGETPGSVAGTGLGLTICKILVELMGGTIKLFSRQGKGTTAVVHLRLPVAEAPSAQQADTVCNDVIIRSTCAPRILLTEDVEVNRRYLVQMLEILGCRVETASTGKDCLQSLEEGDYDLVLLDIQMPEMDGYETACRIRRQVKWRNLPVVALTADAMTGTENRCREAGCNAYLSKPVTLDQLRDCLESQLGQFNLEQTRLEKDITRKLMPEFLEYLFQAGNELENFLTGGEIDRAVSIAHDLKGTAGLYGLANISRLMEELLVCLRGGDYHDLRGWRQQFKQELLNLPTSSI